MLKLTTKFFLPAIVMMLVVVGFSSLVSTYAQNSDIVPDTSAICPDTGCPVVGDPEDGNYSREGIAQLITNIAQFITFVGVALSILFMVYGGIRYITAGTADGNETGKKILINATIGLIVSIVAYSIVALIANIVSSPTLGEGIINS